LSQAKRYDKQAEYIKYWLPELQEVPNQLAQSVWELSFKEQEKFNVKLGGNYPKPIINVDKWYKTYKY